jgi:hypothetical protein
MLLGLFTSVKAWQVSAGDRRGRLASTVGIDLIVNVGAVRPFVDLRVEAGARSEARAGLWPLCVHQGEKLLLAYIVAARVRDRRLLTVRN